MRRRVSLSKSLPVFHLVLLSVALVVGIAQAQSPWPTPPPGPPFPFPSGMELTADVVSPAVPDDVELFVVRPRWPGYTPLVAPLQSDTFTFTASEPHLSIRVEAGTYAETVQVVVGRHTPRDLDEYVGRELLIGYSLVVLDKDGTLLLDPPRRPFLVTVPVGPFMERGLAPERLLFVSLDGAASVLLPTSYDRANGVLSTRLVKLQGVGIVYDA